MADLSQRFRNIPCPPAPYRVRQHSRKLRLQPNPGRTLPSPPSDALRSPGSVPPEGTPCAALGLARRPCPYRPSHGGFQLHRIRHRRPLAPTPQNLGLALQAAAWARAAGASQEPPCGGRKGCGVREGPHGTLFAALTRTGTSVNAAVGGPVNALHGLPPPRAGLPGTFLPPMGAAPCSNGRCTVPHPSPPGARERHRLRPCQTKVSICWGAWGSSPHTPRSPAVPRGHAAIGLREVITAGGSKTGAPRTTLPWCTRGGRRRCLPEPQFPARQSLVTRGPEVPPSNPNPGRRSLPPFRRKRVEEDYYFSGQEMLKRH